MRSTVTESPSRFASSRTRNGNRPSPAMRPSRSGRRSVVFVFPALDDHPSLRGADELQERAHVGTSFTGLTGFSSTGLTGAVLAGSRQPGDRLRHVHRRMHQDPVSRANRVDPIAAEAAPFEADGVDPVEE